MLAIELRSSLRPRLCFANNGAGGSGRRDDAAEDMLYAPGVRDRGLPLISAGSYSRVGEGGLGQPELLVVGVQGLSRSASRLVGDHAAGTA